MLHTRVGDQFLGVILKPNDLAIIALNSLLPACMRPRKGLCVLCTAPNIILHIRVGIWLGVELGDVKLVRIEMALIMPSKRSIGTNWVTTTRWGNNCWVEETSNSERTAM